MQKRKKTVKSPLTPEQIEHYKELLKQLSDKLTKRINNSSSNLQSNRQAGEEAADVGGDDFIRETGIAIMADDSAKLRLIAQAVRHMEDGTYGICQVCGNPIGEGRLEVKPYARFCITCKEKREKSGIKEYDN